MDIPTYVEMSDQTIYHQDFNQTLRTGLSDNGWTVPQLTSAQLTTDSVLNPSTGQPTVLSQLMPDGTIWFVTDATPPAYVGKINGALVKFTTTEYS